MEKLLCVEDEYSNAFVVKTLLKGLYEVDVASKAQQGLALLQGYPYKAALLDINLGKGEMNGIELMQIIRESPGKQPVLIATTAYAMPGEKENILESGFDHYLSKPLNREELLSVLEHTYSQTTS